MKESDIIKLFERLGRLTESAKLKTGSEMTWQYSIPDGRAETVSLKGLRCHLELEDSINTLFIWIWNCKDYLKKRAKNLGKDPQSVEELVNANLSLSVAADLANGLKHGGLDRKGRSEYNPKLGNLKVTAPQAAFETIAFMENRIEFRTKDAALVEFEIPVLSDNGDEIGDALSLASDAIEAFETFSRKLENAA